MRGRGSVHASADDVGHHGVKIRSHVASGYTDCLDALTPNPIVASRVPLRVIAHVMPNAVYLDREARRLAIEVEYEWAKGMLPSEA